MRDEIRHLALEAPKKRLVDTFYNEVNRTYELRPDSVDFDQFAVNTDA